MQRCGMGLRVWGLGVSNRTSTNTPLRILKEYNSYRMPILKIQYSLVAQAGIERSTGNRKKLDFSQTMLRIIPQNL